MSRPQSWRRGLALVLLAACGGGGTAGPGKGGAGGDEPVGGASGAGGAPGRDAGSPVRDSGSPDGREPRPEADAAGAPPDAQGSADLGPPPADAGPLPPMGNPFVYVGASSDVRVRIYRLDMATGALAPAGMALANASPHYFAVHPSRKFLYVTSQVAAGRVVAFSIDGGGQLTRINDAATGGAEPAHISVHRSGRWLLVANYTGGNASVLPIGADGGLAAPVSTVPAGAEAHMIVDDGVTGNFVFVPSKGSNRIGQFKFDAATGKLEPNDPPTVAEAGAPRHIAFHRSGKFAYLLTEASRTVVAYGYDAATGRLSALTRVVAGATGFASHIAMHPARDLFYAAVRGPDTITTYAVEADGKPRMVGQVDDELSYPWDFSVDATGTYLVAANNTSASIKVFRLDAQAGTPSLVGGAAVPAQTRAVRVVFPP